MPTNDENIFTATMSLAWRQATALFAFSSLANALLLVSAVYTVQVYDRVLSTGSLDTLLWLTVATMAAVALYGLLEHARRLMLGRIGLWIDQQLSGPAVRKALEARLVDGTPEGGPKEVADLRGFITGEGILAFLDAPWAPAFMAGLWLLHPLLGAVASVGALALFVGALANDVLTRKQQRTTSAALRRSQDAAQRYVHSAETISALGMTGAVVARWEERQRTVQGEQQRLTEITTAIMSASRSLRLALQVITLGVGAYCVLQGQLTAGAMIAASILLGRALAPIERSIGAWRGFVSARVALGNLERLFGRHDAREAIRLPRPAGRLEVKNLHDVLPGSRDPILKNVSFDLAAGQTCAVIGASGSGKTSLCRLLVGARRPFHGHVRLDGAEVSGWDPEDLGPYIGYVPQHVELFPGTVADNIARLRTADSEAVIAAAKLVGIHDMILRLPDGYRTDVGVHGSKISHGQRQRLGLARAVYGNPALLVLDEPNANLDSEGEQALLAALARLKQEGRTVVMVTHQAAAVHLADRVLVLVGGSAAMFGERDEVLRALASRRHQNLATAAERAEMSRAPRPTLVAAE